MVKWSGRLGRGDARVDAFLAFVVCASFGKKPVSRSASNGTDYFHWSSHGMISDGNKSASALFLKEYFRFRDTNPVDIADWC